MKIDAFTKSYIETALWSSLDDQGEPLSPLYSINDLSTECLSTMIADCQDFQQSFGDLVASNPQQAGADFWLTRNHHGSGFWDGHWMSPFPSVTHDIGAYLTSMSHPYGESYLYVNHNNMICCQ